MIRNKILSDINSLNQLNKIYNWLPNETMVRPTPEDLQKKNTLISLINREWLSTKDYILHNIFGKEYQEVNGIKFVKDLDNLKEWVFLPSLFRYNLENHSNHYILWNSKFKFIDDIDDEIINEILEKELVKLLNHDEFDFAWYKNPKPSVPEFYHLQVFFTQKIKI